MCDTLLAPPASTAERTTLFGKNSDRQRNEAQSVEYFPSANHASDARVACTYIRIPAVERTHAVLLCRPFWTWGAEMGANECGVVIGNEGLQARTPAPRDPSLIGMDLLRLALERSDTAAGAVETIAILLEEYGQGGNCGHLTPSYYNNGFIVADPTEAFVLETIGREWLVERVRDVRSISNRYSIDGEPDRTSAHLSELMRRNAWAVEERSNYAEAIADPNREHIGNAAARRARSTALLRSRFGALTISDMVSILRDHGPRDRAEADWRADVPLERTLCMHAACAERPGQTVGSMVSELRAAGSVHWLTGTAAPCISLFKPVFLDVPLPAQGPKLTDRFDPRALWWRHERLHRAALASGFESFIEEIRIERDALEQRFQQRVQSVLAGGSPGDREYVVAECWKDAQEAEERWAARRWSSRSDLEPTYVSTWGEMSRLAQLADLS